MLTRILKRLGFRRKEELEGYLDHYGGLDRDQQEAILDAYGSVDPQILEPAEQLAQTALNLWRSNKHHDALAFYDRAIELVPADSTLLLNRGNLQFELGNISAAIADFELAMRGSPRLPEHLFGNYTMIQNLGQDSPILQAVIEKRRKKRDMD